MIERTRKRIQSDKRAKWTGVVERSKREREAERERGKENRKSKKGKKKKEKRKPKRNETRG